MHEISGLDLTLLHEGTDPCDFWKECDFVLIVSLIAATFRATIMSEDPSPRKQFVPAGGNKTSDVKTAAKGINQKGWHNLQSFEKRLKRLKKDFQRNVSPSIRRHRYYLSKGERSRLKHEKAIKRLNKKRYR